MLDEVDKKMLRILQKEFPLVEQPFLTVAEKCGIKEEEAIARIQKLKDNGLIRRIGAVFDGVALGRASTLCAARVPEEKLGKFVNTVNAFPGVTHNYRRNNDYNVWFTVNAENEEELTMFILQLKKQTGVSDILDMRAVRTFKINTSFDI